MATVAQLPRSITGWLMDRPREGIQVIGLAVTVARIDRFRVEPDDFPPTGRRQPTGVVSAQVIAVWFGVSSQRAQDSGGVGIHIGQRGDGGPTTPGLRAGACSSHVPDVS